MASAEVGVAYVTLMPSMNSFAKEVRNALKSDDVSKALANGVANSGKEAGEKLGKSVANAFSKYARKNIADSFAKPFANSVRTTMVNELKNSLVQIRKLFATAGEAAGSEFAGGLHNGLQNSSFKDSFSSVFDGMKTELPDVSETIGAEAGSKTGAGFMSSFSNSFDRGNGGISGLLAGKLGISAGYIQVAAEVVAKIWEKVDTLMSNIMEKAQEVGIEVARRIFTGIEKAYAGVAQIMEKIGGFQIKTAAKGLGIDLGLGLDEGLTTIDYAFGNVLGDIFGNVISTAEGNLQGAIERFDTMQNFPRIMANMGIEADTSSNSINRLSDAIDGLPTGLNDITTFTEKIFPAFNKDLSKATDVAIAFNNALVAGGKTMGQQQNAMEQWSQMIGNAKVDMLSWRSVNEAMPAQMQQIAESFGAKNSQELYNMLPGSQGAKENGVKVTLEELSDAFIKLNNEGLGDYASFAEQAKVATFGIGTALTNLGNRVEKAWGVLFEYVGQSNIANFINNITSKFVPAMQDVSTTLDNIGAKKTFNDIGDKLSDGVDKLSEKLGPIKERLEPLLSGALSLALSTVSDTVDHIVETADPFIKFISDKIDEFTNNLPQIQQQIQPIINAFIDFKTTTLEKAVDMWQKIFDAFTKINEDTGKSPLETIINSLASVTGTIATFVGNTSDVVAPVLAHLFETIAKTMEVIEPVAEQLVRVLAPVVQTMADTIAQVVQILFGPQGPVNIILSMTDENGIPLIQSFVQKMSDTIVKIVQLLAPHLPKLFTTLITIAEVITDAVFHVMEKLEPYIDGFFDFVSNGAVKLADTIKSIADEFITPENIEKIREASENLLTFATEHMRSIFIQCFILFTRLSGIWSSIQTFKDVWLPGIESTVGNICDLIRPVLDKINNITKWFDGLGEKLNGTIKEKFNVDIDFNDKKWDKLKELIFAMFTPLNPMNAFIMFGSGGIVNGPTPGIIGEAGTPEAVVPLSAEGIAKFTSGLDAKYKNGGGPTVNVNIDTFVNNDTNYDVNSLCNEIGNVSIRKLREQGVAA